MFVCCSTENSSVTIIMKSLNDQGLIKQRSTGGECNLPDIEVNNAHNNSSPVHRPMQPVVQGVVEDGVIQGVNNHGLKIVTDLSKSPHFEKP